VVRIGEQIHFWGDVFAGLKVLDTSVFSPVQYNSHSVYVAIVFFVEQPELILLGTAVVAPFLFPKMYLP
jgi:hypothetical protein